jgi:hypothetical protein
MRLSRLKKSRGLVQRCGAASTVVICIFLPPLGVCVF